MSWSDSYFIPWLNETTVLDYFCDTRNPFYSDECNNQLLKMQGVNPEQLRLIFKASFIFIDYTLFYSIIKSFRSSMIGNEYQLYISKPPLYVIRKVQRISTKDG
jgi:hypothetical protein